MVWWEKWMWEWSKKASQGFTPDLWQKWSFLLGFRSGNCQAESAWPWRVVSYDSPAFGFILLWITKLFNVSNAVAPASTRSAIQFWECTIVSNLQFSILCFLSDGTVSIPVGWWYWCHSEAWGNFKMYSSMLISHVSNNSALLQLMWNQPKNLTILHCSRLSHMNLFSMETWRHMANLIWFVLYRELENIVEVRTILKGRASYCGASNSPQTFTLFYIILHHYIFT